MNRRHVCLTLLSLPLLAAFRDGGCERRRDNLASLLDTLGNAVSKLATVMGKHELSDRIQHHTNAAVSLLRAWVPGRPTTVISAALNLLIDDLKQIIDDRFRPLVTLALGTIAAIIDKIKGERPHTDIKLTDPPESSGQFKDYWDHIRAGSPGMEEAPII